MRTNSRFKTSQTVTRQLFVNLAASLILTVAQPTRAQTQQRTFASAAQASQALYDAVRNEDDQAVQSILGAPQLTSTGDGQEDKLERQHFGQKYQEMHRLVRESDGSTVLYIGAENWPFPIPLVSSDGKWRFDSDSGSQEILAREVGENEATVIRVCQAVKKVNAMDTSKAGSNDPILEFAEKLAQSGSTIPGNELFHGYYFRTSSGLGDKRLVVAYPAYYRISGVMTFIATRHEVFEKDLGPQTATIAQKIQGKPTRKWTAVQ
jgi:Protein of unknown function (DUF2950)